MAFKAESLKLRLVLSCCLVVPAVLPAAAQTGFQIEPAATKAKALSLGGFHCHTGYPLGQCEKDILQLKAVLAGYPIENLGPWTWVLVRSQDWKPISRRLRLNPDSPAFTALDQRATFLEEALFLHDPTRSAELMRQWQMSMPRLLELAVTHELGHALCAEPNEAAADRFGEKLRNGQSPPCRVTKLVKESCDAAGLHALH